MAGKQQYLMPAGRIKHDALHIFEALNVPMYQCFVQYHQGRPFGFPQQIGMSQAVDQPHLFPRPKTQLGNPPQLNVACRSCSSTIYQSAVYKNFGILWP